MEMAEHDGRAGELDEGQVVGDLPLPANQPSTELVRPGVGTLDDPMVGPPLAVPFHLELLVPSGTDGMGEAAGFDHRPHAVEVVPLVHAQVLGDRRRKNAPRLEGGSTSLQSFLFAGATTTARGIPAPSVRRLRLVPLLARSVGLGPVASPPRGALAMAPSIDCQVHWIPTFSS